MSSALGRRWPALAFVPREELATLPTPVERADGLSGAVGAEVWIKRDDRTASLYGGNKIRKLELLLAEARAREARTIVTTGAFGSHHVLATALHARPRRMRVMAPLFPQPLTEHARQNLHAILALGVEVTPVGSLPAAVATMTALAARATLRERRSPYWIGPGGSSPLGTIGYVEAGLELADQIERGALPAPDAIFVAFGSGGTAAGILAGLALAGLGCTVHAVGVTPAARIGGGTLRLLARAALRRLRAVEPSLPRVRLPPLVVDRTQLGPGYGHPTPEAEAAIACARSLEALELEPTYTGRTLAALLAAARGPAAGRRLLYWHTVSAAPASALGLGPVPPDALLSRLPAEWR